MINLKGNKKELMKKAHMITKEIIKKGDNYKATLSIVLKDLYSEISLSIVKTILTINKVNKEIIKKSEFVITTGNIIKCENEVNSLYKLLINNKKTKSHRMSKNHAWAIGEFSEFDKVVQYEITNNPRVKSTITFDNDFKSDFIKAKINILKTFNSEIQLDIINDFCKKYNCFDSSRFDYYCEI